MIIIIIDRRLGRKLRIDKETFFRRWKTNEMQFFLTIDPLVFFLYPQVLDSQSLLCCTELSICQFTGPTRNSRVLGMSKIDLTPLETTAIDVLPSSVRSAETSIVLSTSRCTPPIPPVAKISIPTKLAHIIVPETVVPPFKPLLRTYARSLLEVFKVGVIAPFPKISKSPTHKPTLILPLIIAIVAGTDPYKRSIYLRGTSMYRTKVSSHRKWCARQK